MSAASVAPRRPRRILLSAFACSPLWGSEPGVGWHWLLHLAARHEVVLLTHAHFRGHLEPALAAAGLASLEAHYVQAPAFGIHPHLQLNSRLYYAWWQWHVRGLARRLLRERRFDLVHHLTWGTLRLPCLLGGLGAPLVIGPLGGGEAAPLRLFAGLPLRVRAFEALRALSLRALRLDPLALHGPRRAALVLCKSPDSLRALPPALHGRSLVMPEIGSPPVDPAPAGSGDAAARPLQLLFAGRLLGWKGVALALGAAARLLRAGCDVRLDIAGDGPLRRHLEARIARERLGGSVRLLGMLPREQLLARYREADLFVFPSLHDASGNVVLEALSRGLPVVCLDLGGPQLYVDAGCGVVVATAGRSGAEVEQGLADAIAGLAADPARRARMRRHALAHAARQDWATTVRRACTAIEERLGWTAAPADIDSAAATLRAGRAGAH